MTHALTPLYRPVLLFLSPLQSLFACPPPSCFAWCTMTPVSDCLFGVPDDARAWTAGPRRRNAIALDANTDTLVIYNTQSIKHVNILDPIKKI